MRDKCIDKPPKKIFPKTTLDKIFRRRNVANSQYYFTDRKHAVQETSEAEAKPKVKSHRVPKSQKLLSYIKYSDRNQKLITKGRLVQPLHLKDSYKIAATRDISQRLYIKDIPNDVKTVIDIHPAFYSAIEGRPLRSFDDIKVYVTNIRMYAMNRQQIGYRKDKMQKLTMDIDDENREYEIVESFLRKHIVNFQTFLTDDYKRACAKVAKAEKIHELLQERISEYIGSVIQLTLINNVLFKLDSIRNVLKIYRTYLLFAAPLYWRQEFDETYKPLTEKYSEGAFITHSEEFITDNDLVETISMEKIAENALLELKQPYHCNLYFKHPQDMVYMFRTMELQSREYLIQLSKTQAPYKMLLRSIMKLKESTKKELEFSQFYIDSIKIETERELYNEIYLQEKFMRILNESFFDTVASPDILKLKICIEYVYEQIFGKCDEGHQNLRDPMKILEVKYEDYNLLLDKLDFNVVNQARKDFFEQDLQMMRDAYQAQRELREFYEMTTAMNKAFLPPFKFKRPELKKFMPKKAIIAAKLAEKRKLKLASGERIKRKTYKVSEEDRENLIFFTDWCDGMNPAPFLKYIETHIKPVLK